MTIPENIRDVALKLVTPVPASLMFLVLLFIAHDMLVFYLLHDLQLERIKAVMTIFQSCTDALNRGTL